MSSVVNGVSDKLLLRIVRNSMETTRIKREGEGGGGRRKRDSFAEVEKTRQVK